MTKQGFGWLGYRVGYLVFERSFSAAEVLGDIDIAEVLCVAGYGAAGQSNFIHELAKLGIGIDVGDA